jgi:hypothetical protein
MKKIKNMRRNGSKEDKNFKNVIFPEFHKIERTLDELPDVYKKNILTDGENELFLENQLCFEFEFIKRWELFFWEI